MLQHLHEAFSLVMQLLSELDNCVIWGIAIYRVRYIGFCSMHFSVALAGLNNIVLYRGDFTNVIKIVFFFFNFPEHSRQHSRTF